MKRLILKWRIAYLRHKAKAAYLDYALEALHSDCGNALLQVCNPKASRAALKYNAAMRKLNEIDPDFLKGWVPWL